MNTPTNQEPDSLAEMKQLLWLGLNNVNGQPKYLGEKEDREKYIDELIAKALYAPKPDETVESILNKFRSVVWNSGWNSSSDKALEDAEASIATYYAAKLKEAELSARIDELKNAKASYQRTYKQTITDGVGDVYLDDSHHFISSYEVQERIFTLQQELASLKKEGE